ncbi:MAG: VOC family protein [Anaerovoracaceae bacterium]
MKEENTIVRNIIGLQHIGIPVSDLKTSIDFYERLGFACVMYRELKEETNTVKVSMMKHDNIIIELYQSKLSKPNFLNKDGFIDHIAFNVRNFDDIYQEIIHKGFKAIEGPKLLDFWEKGCRYFTIRGPEGEKIEFNEIVK